MGWRRFEETDVGRVPDDIIYYLCKYVVNRGLKGINNMPRQYSYDDAISDCLADAYYYNNKLCHADYPITVNIGFCKKHVYARFLLRMKKYFDIANATRTVGKFKSGKKEGAPIDFVDKRASNFELLERQELKGIAKEIYKDWEAKEPSDFKRDAYRRYLKGDTIRDIARDHGKAYQYVNHVLVEITNKLKVEAVQRSSERQQILANIRAANPNWDLVASYIEGDYTINALRERLSQKYNRKYSASMTNQEIKRALNFAFQWQ